MKRSVNAGVVATYQPEQIRTAIYRPFTAMSLYFEEVLTHRRGRLPNYFPAIKSGTPPHNKVIAVSDIAFRSGYSTYAVNQLCDLHLCATTDVVQCFPFYTYNEDGSNRRENITDWALAEFRKRYADKSIFKWDIFHATYAILHHPEYRTRYAANLKRELPRIPFVPEFHEYARIGAALMQLHIDYEKQKEYPLQRTEKGKLDWRVRKMSLSKDKSQLKYNDFLTLSGSPPEVYEYRLGNRSALEWVVDQYRVKKDERSGIVNDPNREDDPEYIVRLIGQVVTVSLETVKLVRELADLALLREKAVP